MTNQWGRNDQGARSGSGGPNIVLPAVLCLALIGSGGYFWYVRQSLQTEITMLSSQSETLAAELSQVTAERNKAVGDLANSRKNAGTWAGELEQDYADLTLNELPKLHRLLDKRDADIAALEKRITSEKAAAKAAADDLNARIDQLNAALAEAKDESVTAAAEMANRAKELEKLTADRAALTQEIAGLRSTLERSQADVVSARKELEQRVETDQKQPPTFKSALDLARDVQIKTLEQSLIEERRKVAVLEDALASYRAETPEAPADVQPQDDLADQAPDGSQSGSGAALRPRDRTDVETIVSGTRGLGLLDDEKTERLKDELVAGACVTDALESVFDKVPLVLMRNLMRDFKSDC